MNKINEKNRKETILILEKYLSGEILPSKILGYFPNYEDDELLESVINSFSEPLRDTGYTSWEEFTKVCIKALKENWSLEKFDQTPK
jgi:hypothetical protein